MSSTEGQNENTGKSGYNHATWWLVAAFALLIAYPLSIGPLVYLTEKDHIPEEAEDTLSIIYAPILWLMDSSEQVSAGMEVYIGWWEGLAE